MYSTNECGGEQSGVGNGDVELDLAIQPEALELNIAIEHELRQYDHEY